MGCGPHWWFVEFVLIFAGAGDVDHGCTPAFMWARPVRRTSMICCSSRPRFSPTSLRGPHMVGTVAPEPLRVTILRLLRVSL